MLDRNWRCDVGELDLVLGRGRLVVFAEVKARATAMYGSPASAVGEVKRRRVRALAARWLADRGVHGVDVRFDVVAVTGTEVEVIEAAF